MCDLESPIRVDSLLLEVQVRLPSDRGERSLSIEMKGTVAWLSMFVRCGIEFYIVVDSAVSSWYKDRYYLLEVEVRLLTNFGTCSNMLLDGRMIFDIENGIDRPFRFMLEAGVRHSDSALRP